MVFGNTFTNQSKDIGFNFHNQIINYNTQSISMRLITILGI
jgi:hypothetical protein